MGVVRIADLMPLVCVMVCVMVGMAVTMAVTMVVTMVVCMVVRTMCVTDVPTLLVLAAHVVSIPDVEVTTA